MEIRLPYVHGRPLRHTHTSRCKVPKVCPLQLAGVVPSRFILPVSGHLGLASLSSGTSLQPKQPPNARSSDFGFRISQVQNQNSLRDFRFLISVTR